MRRPAVVLLFLSVLTFFLGLGRPAITDSDEAYYAESAREMVDRGDWLTPFYNYEYRWQKPVLYYWLTAVTYRVAGVGEWSARAWSALAGLGLVFVTCAAGRRLTGYDDVGWLAGAITATAFGYFSIARLALPDLVLALFITIAIVSAFQQRWAMAGVAAGLGFLVKGPLAVVIPGLVLAPMWWKERRVTMVRPRDLAVCAAMFAIVGLPWYVAMALTHGTAYLQSFFVGDNLERFATTRFNEPRSIFFYVPILLGGLLPWTAYLLVSTWRPFRELVARRLVLSAADWRLAIWAGMPLLFFSASIGKQPRYILPVLPPVAIFLARAILNRLERARTGDAAARRELNGATLVTAAFLFAFAILLARARPLFLTAVPLFTWIAVVALLACAAALALVSGKRLAHLPLVLPPVAAVALLAAQFGALSGKRPEPVEDMAALIRQHRTGQEEVGEYQVFVRNMIFYTGFRQENLYSEKRALEFFQQPGRVLMVVRPTDLARFETVSGVEARVLGSVPYVNTANLKLPQLLSPLPAQDIQRILLVSNR